MAIKKNHFARTLQGRTTYESSQSSSEYYNPHKRYSIGTAIEKMKPSLPPKNTPGMAPRPFYVHRVAGLRTPTQRNNHFERQSDLPQNHHEPIAISKRPRLPFGCWRVGSEMVQ